MTTTDFRERILARIESLDLTIGHVATLAGLSDQTARDYLQGDHDLATDRTFRLARAVGLEIAVRPARGFSRPKPPVKGRKPTKTP